MEVLKNLNKKLCIYDDDYIGIEVGEVLKDQKRYRGATDKEIRELESYTKLKLPEDYIKFLKEAMNVAITSKKKKASSHFFLGHRKYYTTKRLVSVFRRM